MNSSPLSKKKGAIDKAVFWPATILTLLMTIVFLIYPKASGEFMGKLHAFTTGELGWFFLLSTGAAVIFCLYLALSAWR